MLANPNKHFFNESRRSFLIISPWTSPSNFSILKYVGSIYPRTRSSSLRITSCWIVIGWHFLIHNIIFSLTCIIIAYISYLYPYALNVTFWVLMRRIYSYFLKEFRSHYFRIFDLQPYVRAQTINETQAALKFVN